MFCGVELAATAGAPGGTETAVPVDPAATNFRRLDPEVFERVAEWYPLRRVGEPQDVAEAALFLASDTSAWITGTVLVVDGGLTAGNMPFTRTLMGYEPGQPDRPGRGHPYAETSCAPQGSTPATGAIKLSRFNSSR